MKQPTPQWVFERMNPMGGSRSTAWRDTLEGLDLSIEARIAREAIQNSADATLAGEKTEVLVWDKPLTAEEESTLREILDLDSQGSPTGRLEELGLEEGNFFDGSRTVSGEVRVTIIEDHNTWGLGIDTENGKDRFEELCLFLGQDDTEVDPNRGGSYGFGKTVYQANSGCRTFVVYSHFVPKPPRQDRSALLFACSHFAGHSIGDHKFTGRAWFGVPDLDELGQQICKPLVNEEAHQLAKRLGFIRRDQGDFGTSIMILESCLDMEAFKGAVEDYWWPRLVSDELAVELWQGDSNVMPPPEPQLRSKLEPYIRCYGLAEDDIPNDEDERVQRLNAFNGVQAGKLALKASPPSDPNEDENPDEDSHFRNTVALIRSGPKMVVGYLNTGGRQRGNFAGTFVSHPDAEGALHLSEPAAHNAWNPNSERLRKADSSYPQLVKSILNRVKAQTRRFQKDFSPALPPEPVMGTRRLEQILSRIMSGKLGGGATLPPPAPDVFQVRIDEKRRNASTGSTVVATVEVKLRDEAGFDEADAFVSIRPTVLLDDDLRREKSERLKLATVMVDGVKIDSVDETGVAARISKNRAITVEAESEHFGREMSAELEVAVSLAEEPDGHMGNGGNQPNGLDQ